MERASSQSDENGPRELPRARDVAPAAADGSRDGLLSSAELQEVREQLVERTRVVEELAAAARELRDRASALRQGIRATRVSDGDLRKRTHRAAADGTSGRTTTTARGETMAKQSREMEGNNEQRRKAAREARAQGKLPSEMGATLGASKQRHEMPKKATHQERLEARGRGKTSGSRLRREDTPRPGSRDQDPKRDERWG